MHANSEGKYRIPILTYHSIDTSGSIISTSPEKFLQQMQFLSHYSYNVISLSKIISFINEKQPFPKKTVAITFDDGFNNIFEIAYPILRKLGYTATIFLVTGYCGKKNNWSGQLRGVPEFDLLEWDKVIEMANNGIEFGSHTMSHPDLTELTLAQAREEIVGAKRSQKERLGKEPLFFAYPYGRESNKIREIVRDEFKCALSTVLEFVNTDSNIYSLPRIDMCYFSRNNFFTWLGTSKFSGYINIRKFLRSLRSI
ncbi:polysaccharide deacetylase [Candidatus Scalindua japonica]|uniref:Polysaccharide deacetylase n=1 Tax=Candidatus Scalindua japonica TaxID=1284222 RepID=A0A286TX41_9BACT|nr:polysaccharide deacetylase family protein [Candidatus Scalindua japonica]GAX60448.1 polysaccharide deacetylase [Candidatus Scalindua japonica]